jgi:hypothetical protein
MNLLIALFLITFKAVKDGLNMRGLKTWAGRVEIVYLAAIVLMVYAYAHSIPSWWFPKDTYLVSIIGFVFLRYGIHSFIVNAIAGQELSYIGHTKDTDKAGIWLFNRFHISKSLLIFTKGISALVGLSLLAGFRHGIFWWVN